MIAILALFPLTDLQAAIFKWSGAEPASSNKNTDAENNWHGNVAPPHGGISGSDVADWEFAGFSKTTPILANHARLRSLKFTSGSNFHLSYNSLYKVLTVNESIENLGGGSARLSPYIALNGNVTFEAKGNDLTFSGSILTSNYDLNLKTGSGKTISIEAGLEGGYSPQSGGTGIRKVGPGTVELSSGNEYSAPFTVAEGSLHIRHSGALSTETGAKLIVESGTTVKVVDGIALSDSDMSLSGALVFEGDSSWPISTGDFTMLGSNATVTATGTSASLGANYRSSSIGFEGSRAAFIAESGATLEIDAGLSIDPQGGNFDLHFGPYASGGTGGTILMSGAAGLKPSSSGNLRYVFFESALSRLSDVDLSDFDLAIVNSAYKIQFAQGFDTNKIPALSGGGIVDLGGTVVHSIVEVAADPFANRFSGTMTSLNGIKGRYRKYGPGKQILSGDASNVNVQIYEGTLELADGTISNSGTSVSGGTLTGRGVLDLLSVEDGGVLDPSLFNGFFMQPSKFTTTRTILGEDAVIKWMASSWTGTGGLGWAQILADQIDCNASPAKPCVIQINTDGLSGFDGSSKEFPIVVGASSFNGFDADEFVIQDVSATPLDGTWSIQGSAGSTQAVTLKYTPTGGYDTWIGSFGYSGDDAEPHADPDHDGQPNFAEFIFGGLPNDATSRPGIETTFVEDGGSDFLKISYNRNNDSAYLDPIIQVSSDLSGWAALSSVSGHSSNPTVVDAGTTQIEELIPFDSVVNPKRFFRLQVTLP